MVWLPTEVIMWTMVPAHLRVAFVCAVSLIWQVFPRAFSRRLTRSLSFSRLLTPSYAFSRLLPPSPAFSRLRLAGPWQVFLSTASNTGGQGDDDSCPITYDTLQQQPQPQQQQQQQQQMTLDPTTCSKDMSKDGSARPVRSCVPLMRGCESPGARSPAPPV